MACEVPLLAASHPNCGQSAFCASAAAVASKTKVETLLIERTPASRIPPARRGERSAPRRRGSGPHVFIEPVDGPLPGQVRRRFVVALRSEEHTSELQSRFDLVCR